MNETEILQLIKNESTTENNKLKLPCGKAWEISSKYDVSLKKIGEICNVNSIKIKDCSLGCF